MKIGIACYPTYGGSGVVASELGIELAARGHEIHVISTSEPFRLAGYRENIFLHEIDVGNYPLFKYPPFTLSAACKMIEIAETHQLDVLHVHYALPWAVCAHLAREVVAESCRALRIVTTLHGTDITVVGAEPSFFKMTKFGIERSDAVTAVSNYLADETRKTFGVKVPIDVIHNFVDAERFKPADAARCRKHFAPKGEKLMMHVSNFRPVKNVGDVVKTFALVKKRQPVRLLMIGEGPELPEARNLARSLGVADDVLFLGKQESVQDVLPSGDLFVLPSAFESFGLAALEAMSCGLPVLATEIGGLGEVITPGVDGYLCRVGDCECMAEQAVGILGNEARRSEMGAAARKKAIERFSPQRIVAQYEAVYQRVCAQPGPCGK